MPAEPSQSAVVHSPCGPSSVGAGGTSESREAESAFVGCSWYHHALERYWPIATESADRRAATERAEPALPVDALASWWTCHTKINPPDEKRRVLGCAR